MPPRLRRAVEALPFSPLLSAIADAPRPALTRVAELLIVAAAGAVVALQTETRQISNEVTALTSRLEQLHAAQDKLIRAIQDHDAAQHRRLAELTKPRNTR